MSRHRPWRAHQRASGQSLGTVAHCVHQHSACPADSVAATLAACNCSGGAVLELPRQFLRFISRTWGRDIWRPCFQHLRGQYRISAGVWVPAQPLDHRPERFTLRASLHHFPGRALGSTFAAAATPNNESRSSSLPPWCQYRGRGSTRRKPSRSRSSLSSVPPITKPTACCPDASLAALAASTIC